MGRRHAVEKISMLMLFCASMVVLAGFVPVRFGAFDGIAEGFLKDAGADSVSVGKVSVTLWRGVRVGGIEAHKHIGAKEDYCVSVSQVDASCNLFRMGAAIFTSPPGFLKSDRDIFREVYESPLEFAGDASVRVMSIRPLKRIAVRGAGIRFTGKDGKPGVSADGVSVDIAQRKKLSGSRSLGGSVNAGEAVVPHIAVVRDLNVKLRVDDEKKQLALDGFGHVFGGKLNADLSIDLQNSRISGGSAGVRGLDLKQFCAGTGFAPGKLGGQVDFDARIEPGTPAVLDSIRAAGKVSVSRLTAEDIALQRAAAVSQISKDLRTLRFFSVTGDFRLAGGRVDLSEVVGVGDALSFRSAGWVGFDGKLSQSFEGEFSPRFVAGLPKLVRNSLEATDGGGGRFKCRIAGTFHKPRVDIDKAVYNRGFRSLFR